MVRSRITGHFLIFLKSCLSQPWIQTQILKTIALLKVFKYHHKSSYLRFLGSCQGKIRCFSTINENTKSMNFFEVLSKHQEQFFTSPAIIIIFEFQIKTWRHWLWAATEVPIGEWWNALRCARNEKCLTEIQSANLRIYTLALIFRVFQSCERTNSAV